MINLRRAQLTDHIPIARLHAESWQNSYRGIFSDHYLDHEVEIQHLQTWYRRLSAPAVNQVVTIALHDETPAGFSCLFLNDDPLFGSLLDNLHVSMHLHNSGIGKQLMQDCAKTIIESAGNRKMYLWVFDLNDKARAIYSRWGGTHAETIKKEHADGG